MDQSDRIRIYYDLSAYFRGISFKTCREDLNAFITEGKFLGEGSYGTVNLETINDGDQAGTIVVFKKSSFSNNIDIVREIFGLSACNIMVVNKICPSFPLTYKYGLCLRSSGAHYYYFIQELFESTLEKTYINDETTLVSLLVQGVMAIAAMLDILEIVHDDIRGANVVVKPTTEKYFNYRFGDKTYTIDTGGKLFALIDFGISRNVRFAKFKQEYEPDFKGISTDYHSALYKFNGYSSDLVALLRLIYLHVPNTASLNVLAHKARVERWAEEIIKNQLKSFEDFRKSVNTHLPGFTTLPEQSSGRLFNVTNTKTVDISMKEELYKIVNALFEKKDVPKLILDYYVKNAKLHNDIMEMRNKALIDYSYRPEIKSYIENLIIIPPPAGQTSGTIVVEKDGDILRSGGR